jgi:hypothetical protein
MPGFGRTYCEIVIKLCRAFSYRYPVTCIAVRPERHGSLAKRNRSYRPASQHHGPGTEAGGKAAPGGAGGKATKAGGAGGKQACRSPDIASPSNATDNCPKAGARFSDGEVCRD